MKRFLLLSVAIFSLIFTSCTDNTLEEIENKKNEKQVKFVENGEVGDHIDDGQQEGS